MSYGCFAHSLLKAPVLRAVRMSLLFSVARILNPTHRARYMVTALAALFSLIALAYITVKLWWYSIDRGWLKHTAFYTMPARWLPYPMYIYELCSECAKSLHVRHRIEDMPS